MSDQEKNYTLVFPGQGSQRLGMGMDFSEIFVEAKETFEEASRSLPFNVAELINSEDGRLNETKFTQPCILTVEIALLRVLQKYTSLNAVYYGGHSLGEYTALVAANVIPFELAVSLVYQRGLFMQSSSPVGFGAMAAVILSDLPLADIENMASSYSVDVANDNSTSQIVLSGKADAVKKLCSELEQKYTGTELRIVPLNVSAPFHSRHMVEIEAIFRDTLNVYKKEMNPTNLKKVVSNTTGDFHTGSLEDLIEALTKQLSGRVRWRDNMYALQEKGFPILELGPHRPLRGFFKSIGVSTQSIRDLRSAEKIFHELGVIKKSQEIRKEQNVTI